MKDLKKLVKNKRKLDILCRRMVATTLRESMFIFYNWNYKDMRKERNNAIYSTSSSEDNTNENNYSDILDDNGTVPLWNDNDNDDENVSNVSDNSNSEGEVTRQSFSDSEVVYLESGEASPKIQLTQ